LVTEVVNSAWRLEGEALEGVANALDAGETGEEAVVNLVTALDDLAERAASASEAIRRLGVAAGPTS
jgi:methyl-accepting chemotaxis protein